MGLTEIFNGVFYGIYDILYGVFMGIWVAVEGVIDGIKEMWEGLVKGIKLIFEGFKDGDWSKVWEGLKTIAISVVKGLWKMLKGIISGILTTLWGLVCGVVNIFIGIINGVIGLINGIIRGINQIKVPDWVPGIGCASLNISEIKMIEYWEAKPIKLATGGIANKSVLANIGEKGQEAVVPLTNQTAMEQLGKIMGQYVSGGNNNQPIEVTSVLQVDRKTLAKAVNKANYESGATLTKGAFAL